MTDQSFNDVGAIIGRLASERLEQLHDLPTIATPHAIENALFSLPKFLPEEGIGYKETMEHLLHKLTPALAQGQAGSRYFGFVTGGVTPEALHADWLVSTFDQNVQVHLPEETLSTYVERLALEMTMELIGIDKDVWTGTITTGATASNVLGLACGREAVLRRLGFCASDDGLADCAPVDVFVASPHASVTKAASIVGIGRKRVQECGVLVDSNASVEDAVRALDFDLRKLGSAVEASQRAGHGAIVVIGFGEVNTGAPSAQIPVLRSLCDRYGAWLHVDAAFSAFIGLLPEFQWAGHHLSLADSITSDAHKQLNVPYDAGLFYVRKTSTASTATSAELENVCGPGASGGASYLAAPSASNGPSFLSQMPAIASPLNVNIENSRRFRALPLYAGMLCRGKSGYAEIVERNIAFARRVEEWMRTEGEEWYHVLTPQCKGTESEFTSLGSPVPWTGRWGTNVLLFRANPESCPVKDFVDPKTGHLALTKAIKETRKLYVTSTSFQGRGAIRLAVSNWATTVEQDLPVVVEVLRTVMQA